MFNKKAMLCVALASTFMINTAGMPRLHIQKPSIKVMKFQPIIDKRIKIEKLIKKERLRCIVKNIEPYYIKQIPLSKGLQKYTYNLCKKNHINYTLVLAIMWEESRFQSDKIHADDNGTYDYGICQINTCNLENLKKIGITDILNSYQNIKGCVYLLKPLIISYGEHDGLFAYGYGIEGMRIEKERGVYTTKAVQSVLSKKSEYDKM